MLFLTLITAVLAASKQTVIAPKAVIVNAFAPEAAVWKEHYNFSVSVVIPGLSPLYPAVLCTAAKDLCQITTGEGEINAASTMTAFLTSNLFNLSQSYFLVNGIAGINPYFGGLGSAAFSRYTVNVDLQYEVDSREMPKNWTSGYWAYGTEEPDQFPEDFYGTEVFELNEDLRDLAAKLASKTNLTNTPSSQRTNQLYNIPAARKGAQVLKCDSATSDIYYTGTHLSEAFGNTTSLFTNGSAHYCTTAQEDSAIMEAAVRAARFNLTDFKKWVLLRTGSDFDRPPTSFVNNTIGFFNHNNTGGFSVAIDNLYNAGAPFVKAALGGNLTSNGTNYVGDVFGTLGGKRDFGPALNSTKYNITTSPTGIYTSTTLKSKSTKSKSTKSKSSKQPKTKTSASSTTTSA